MTTTEQLQQIIDLAEKATAGPWEIHDVDDDFCMSATYIASVNTPDHDLIGGVADHKNIIAITLLQTPRLADNDQSDENSAFIVSACNSAAAMARELIEARERIANDTKLIVQMVAEKAADNMAVCTWTLKVDPDIDLWYTDCGEEYYFEEGTPVSNDMKFCSYCGKKLVEKVDEETEASHE